MARAPQQPVLPRIAVVIDMVVDLCCPRKCPPERELTAHSEWTWSGSLHRAATGWTFADHNRKDLERPGVSPRPIPPGAPQQPDWLCVATSDGRGTPSLRAGQL